MTMALVGQQSGFPSTGEKVIISNPLTEDDQHEEVLDIGQGATRLEVEFVNGHTVEKLAHGPSNPRQALLQRSRKEVDKSAKCRFSA
jgi:hypothetical protein